MDLSRISPDVNGLFPFLDWFALVESETQSSVSLAIGRFTIVRLIANPTSIGSLKDVVQRIFFSNLGGLISTIRVKVIEKY